MRVRLGLLLAVVSQAVGFLVPLQGLGRGGVHECKFNSPAKVPSQGYSARRSTIMMATRATMVVSLVTRRTDAPETYEVKTTYYMAEGGDRTWIVSRRYDELEEFERRITSRMGFVLPVLPPRALLIDNLFPLEDYFNKVLELEKVQRDPALSELLDVPREVREMGGVGGDLTPSYKPEVLDEYFRPVDTPDSPGNVKSGAAVAGGVVGFMLGGPLGAMLGAGLSGLAANRQDTAGDVARTAGKAANLAIKKVKDIDQRYEVTRKAGQLLKEGFGKVKEVVDTLDEKN